MKFVWLKIPSPSQNLRLKLTADVLFVHAQADLNAESDEQGRFKVFAAGQLKSRLIGPFSWRAESVRHLQTSQIEVFWCDQKNRKQSYIISPNETDANLEGDLLAPTEILVSLLAELERPADWYAGRFKTHNRSRLAIFKREGSLIHFRQMSLDDTEKSQLDELVLQSDRLIDTFDQLDPIWDLFLELNQTNQLTAISLKLPLVGNLRLNVV